MGAALSHLRGFTAPGIETVSVIYACARDLHVAVVLNSIPERIIGVLHLPDLVRLRGNLPIGWGGVGLPVERRDAREAGRLGARRDRLRASNIAPAVGADYAGTGGGRLAVGVLWNRLLGARSRRR
jgi:hypothetical protein